MNENLKSDPESLDSLMYLARSYAESDKKKDALNAIIHALKIAPNYPEALKLKADILLSLKRYYEALSELKKALKIDETDPEIYFNIATIYYNIKQYDKALESINEAKRVSNGDDEQIYELSSNINSKLDNLDDAISDIDNAIKYSVDDSDNSLKLEKVILLDKSGRFDDALSLVNTILEKDNDDYFAFYILIKILVKNNKVDKLMEIVNQRKLNDDIKSLLNLYIDKGSPRTYGEVNEIIKNLKKYADKDDFESNLYTTILLGIYTKINFNNK